MSLSPLEIDRLADLIAEKVVERLGQSSQSTESATSDKYLDSHQAADLIGCSVPTVERLTRSKKLPSVKLGRLRRYRRSDVMALATKTEVQ